MKLEEFNLIETGRESGRLRIPADRSSCLLPQGSHVLFATLAGSHLYGTQRADSDIDIRAVAIPPESCLLGFVHKFEQFESEGGDTVVFSLKKFFKLCLESNPNIVELLFAPSSLWLTGTPLWQRVLQARSLFLSRKARYRFAGYASAQLHRIKTHRKWLLDPPASKPQRADFGLPAQRLVTPDQIGAFNVVLSRRLEKIRRSHPLKEGLLKMQETSDMLGAIQSAHPLEEPLIEALSEMPRQTRQALSAELEYDAAKRKWDSYQSWLKTRNPERMKLEAKFGYDTKHAMHLFRLLGEGLELLRRGTITFPRPEAPDLLAIREGKLSFEEVQSEADRLDGQFEEAMLDSPLPSEPDAEALDRLYIEIVRDLS